MTIAATPSKLHWNYFVALERDLEQVARYIEFAEQNLGVYSIELAHLLFAAASEVDVVAKLLCEQVDPTAKRGNINDYRDVLTDRLPDLPLTEVFVPRFGLSFKPWVNWKKGASPDWWRSYNNVKHERDAHFNEATLKNVLNALGALLILTFEYYARNLAPNSQKKLDPREVMRQLLPESILLRLSQDHYHKYLPFVENIADGL